MTLEGFKRARELDRLINEAKDNKRSLENIVKRVEEIGIAFTGISIKINEAYYCTPEGSVDISDFTDFLRKEVDYLENIIAVYEQEFAEL